MYTHINTCMYVYIYMYTFTSGYSALDSLDLLEYGYMGISPLVKLVPQMLRGITMAGKFPMNRSLWLGKSSRNVAFLDICADPNFNFGPPK